MKTPLKSSLSLLVMPLCVTAFLASQAHGALSAGLYEYWGFDGNLNASVTASHNGTGVGTVAYTAGKFGQAVDLESSTGTQSHVAVGGTASDFDFVGQSMSFSAWYKAEELYTAWQTVIGKGEGSAYRYGRLNASTSTRLVPGSVDNTGLTIDVWHHVAAVFDYDPVGGTTAITLYVNGTAKTGSGNIASSGLGLLIGENPGAPGRSWDGQIDDVAFWDRTLTAGEVASIYNGGDGASIASLIPEPSSTALLGLGGLALILSRRRR